MKRIDGQLENLTSSTIMMVDDEPTTLDVLEVFLQSEGYSNLIKTTDARQALELLETTNPDVLLLDLMMPNVGGLEILASMRQSDSLGHIPVLILTSSSDAETKLKALELGATDFLSKPIDPSELALRLRNTLAAKAYQDRLIYYDVLTGLPNRRFFIQSLESILKKAKAESTQCAVIEIDLDRFKDINDALGHSVGDALLKAVSDRLEKCVRTRVSRVGGDEFALLAFGERVIERTSRIARRILANLAEPFCLEGRDLFVTASVGISVFPDDGDNVEMLLAKTGIAVSHAKRGGRGDPQFYSEALSTEPLERLSLANQLRRALDRRELSLHYQPKVDLRTDRIVGAEALMRWQHPELGEVPPEKFIKIAEEIGLIGTLGEWALLSACQQSKAWQAAGFEPISMAVNVSGRQFRPDTLLETIRGAVRQSGLDPALLVLELTESVIMDRPEEIAQMLRELKDMGLRISVDDFGTGYSSLTYLKRFPVDEVKIDRSFIKGVPQDDDDHAIVDAIIGMAHSLGLSVVAEGVETAEQLAFLRERGCDQYQGYFCSRPVPPTAWAALFERNRKRE